MGKRNIMSQCALDELNHHQTPRLKSKVKISLFRSKSYQITYLAEVLSRFDQVRPVVSHIEFIIPKKLPTPNNIGGGLKGPQRKFWKEDLFVKYDKNKIVILLLDLI